LLQAHNYIYTTSSKVQGIHKCYIVLCYFHNDLEWVACKIPSHHFWLTSGSSQQLDNRALLSFIPCHGQVG